MALQIRRTDNFESIKNSPIELFEKYAKEEIKSNSSISIFLATDDEGVKEYFGKKFPEHIFYNPARADRKSREGIINGMAELEILSSCKKIYGSYRSSYSEFAAMKGGGELIVVRNDHL